MSVSKTKVVIVNGRLGKDAEVKKVGNDTVINFSVATTETWKEKGTDEKKKSTTWTQCEWWAPMEKLAKSLTKGSSVYIEGTAKHGSYEKAVGSEKVEIPTFKVRVDELILLSSKEGKE